MYSKAFHVGATSYKSTVTITSTNYSYTYNGMTYTNLIQANGTAKGGDSGGIAYKEFKNRNVPFGIIKGGTSTTVNYVKASVILSSIGALPY